MMLMDLSPIGFMVTDFGKAMFAFEHLTKRHQVEIICGMNNEASPRELGNRTCAQLSSGYSRMIQNRYDQDGMLLPTAFVK